MTRLPRGLSVGGERGMALVAVLLLLLVMSGLAIALTTNGRIEVAMGGNEELYIGARAAAESGLNHAASVILPLANTIAFQPDELLKGPDGAIDAGNPSAPSNEDNGVLSQLLGGSAPWSVTAGSAYSYDVRLLDDDDPAMKEGTAFTAIELAAMGPPPDPPEDGQPFHDVNHRLVLRSTGFGPRGTRVTLEQTLTPIKMPALLVNGDLTVRQNAHIVGSQGSVHANGNLVVIGTSVVVERNATATGTLTASESWSAGELQSGDMPRIPVLDIHAGDYIMDADYVLQADGRITNRDATTQYCSAATNGNACRDVTPPGGSAAFGWTFSASQGWNLSQSTANSAAYYVRHNVRISGSPGTSTAPLRLTVIAEGNIEITGNPDLQPYPASEVQFVTDKDLRIGGSLGVPLAFEGRILVREQIDLSSQPSLAGQIIVQSVPSASALVQQNSIAGGVTLSYNGLVETVAYTVTGWREAR